MPVLPKWLVGGLGGLLIAFVALSVVSKAQDLNQRISGKKPDNTMSVSAEGKVKAVPDLATVTLGVVSQGANAADVQDQNSKKINKIIDYVKGQGIAKDDISTSQFNIYPRYDYQNGQNNIIGYEARQTITLKVRGVDKSTDQLGKVLDGVTNNGANEISGVSLNFDDADNFRQQARQQAIEKAKTKAKELADSAGLKLGRVISVSETGGYYPTYAYDSMGYGMGGSAPMAEKSVSPNIEPGQQEITQQMTVIFEVK